MMSMTMFLSGASYLLFAPFMTQELRIKEQSLGLLGWLYSSNAIFITLTCAVSGKLIPYISRESMLKLGLLAKGISGIAFGLSDMIPGDSLWYPVTVLAMRCLDGIGFGFTYTTASSLTTIIFKENTAKAISWVVLGENIGLFASPAFGTILYSIGGFQLPFYFFGGFSVIALFFIPTPEYSEPPKGDSVDISYMELLCYPRYLFAAIFNLLNPGLVILLHTLVSNRLLDLGAS